MAPDLPHQKRIARPSHFLPWKILTVRLSSFAGATMRRREWEAWTTSIGEAVLRGVFTETPDAGVAAGDKWHTVSPTFGFDRGGDGTTTPASAATRTASVGAETARRPHRPPAARQKRAPWRSDRLLPRPPEPRTVAPGGCRCGGRRCGDGAIAAPHRGMAAAALRAAIAGASLAERRGAEAPRADPMPPPLPKTSRPPLPIVTNPLLGKAAGVATVSVPPLIVVPPV